METSQFTYALLNSSQKRHVKIDSFISMKSAC